MKVELGLTSFAENSAIYMPDGKHESISHAQRIRDIVEEIELADQLGLDVYGLGEHHREDYAVSDPVTVLVQLLQEHNISNYLLQLPSYLQTIRSEYMKDSQLWMLYLMVELKL